MNTIAYIMMTLSVYGQVTGIEFNTEAACLKAKEIALTNSYTPYGSKPHIYCIPKG